MSETEMDYINQKIASRRLISPQAKWESLRSIAQGYSLAARDQAFLSREYDRVFRAAEAMHQDMEIISLLLRKFSPIAMKRPADKDFPGDEDKTEVFVFQDEMQEHELDFMLEAKQREDPEKFRKALRAVITILEDEKRSAGERIEALRLQASQIRRTGTRRRAMKAMKSRLAELPAPARKAQGTEQAQPDQERR